jgi:hypothetical protein
MTMMSSRLHVTLSVVICKLQLHRFFECPWRIPYCHSPPELDSTFYQMQYTSKKMHALYALYNNICMIQFSNLDRAETIKIKCDIFISWISTWYLFLNNYKQAKPKLDYTHIYAIISMIPRDIHGCKNDGRTQTTLIQW